jgi:hypothetical protein
MSSSESRINKNKQRTVTPVAITTPSNSRAAPVASSTVGETLVSRAEFEVLKKRNLALQKALGIQQKQILELQEQRKEEEEESDIDPEIKDQKRKEMLVSVIEMRRNTYAMNGILISPPIKHLY